MQELTDKQQEILDAYLANGCVKSVTAKALGTSRSNVRAQVTAIERKGKAPWLSPAPIPDHLNQVKTTVQYDAAGNVIQEWKRLIPMVAHLEEFVEGLCERVEGKAKVKIRKDKKSDTDSTLSEIAIADAHIGMRADAKQSRDANYDCEIARDRLLNTADYFCGRMGRPDRLVLSFCGDMQHMDNMDNVTNNSKNSLDVDSRYNRVVDYVVETCYGIAEMAASIAKTIDIVVVPGNHSETAEVWLAKVLEAYYSQCPNINVLMQRSDHKHIHWGNNLLIWAHGHGVPLKSWGEVIPNEFRKIWGQVDHCHVKTGHFHHRRMKKSSTIVQKESGWEEHGGVIAEILPAACPPDAWHAFKGFRGSMQGLSGFEYHKKYGLYSRFYQPIVV